MTRKQKKNLVRIIVSLSLFFVVFIIDKIIDLGSFIGAPFSWVLPFSLYFIIYIIIGHDILKKAFLGIIHGQVLDENFLMCIATCGAFSLAIYKGIIGEEIEGFDEGCAVLIFYQIGEFFQNYAVSKSRKSISTLMDIRPDYANVYRNGNTENVDPSEVSIDEIILVKPGERVPLDGVIIKGTSTLDTKALTGESLPRNVEKGESILSGSLNLTSDLEIKVSSEYSNSTVSKILDLVENATDKKSKAENFITKFAKYYTPTVVIIAVLLVTIPSLITGDFPLWIYRSLSFLVVSCPCALVISIPLSFFAGIGAASKHGILIKGSNYLEKFNNSNIFIFDKTGTLTKGNFAIKGVYPENKKEEILKYASIAESNSNHPIALSIKAVFPATQSKYTLTDVSGKGIVATDKENTILCGNEKLMIENNISYEKRNDAGTVVYVALNSSYLGCIVIGDEIKEESKDVISYLNNNSCKTIMLTGDNDSVANIVANELKVSEYKSNLLPSDKVEEIESIINKKSTNDVVCFLGDGINDAPSLMRSDIGIAMGGVGSDAAVEASDIVLMHDDLSSLITAKKISKKTMRIVFENIIFAISVKVIILILSALGIANMWIAVFGDVGVAIIAILNALRVNTKYN